MLPIVQSDQIYQTDPELGYKRSSGWRTYNGYLRSAKQVAYCLIQNNKLTPYRHEATISFIDTMTPAEHGVTWKMFSKNMRRRGVSMFWVREPTKSNTIHYHMIIVTPDCIRAAEDAIRAACPKLYRERLRLHIEAIQSVPGWSRYIVKAKTAGYSPGGTYTTDKWAGKRLLFNSNLKLDKIGSIGPFWSRPQRAIWSECIKQEKRIALYKPDVYDEAGRLHEMLSHDLSFDAVLRTLAWGAWKAAGDASVCT